MKPTIGRILHYRLSSSDCERIHQGRQQPGARGGNTVAPGDVVPMLVVRAWSETCVNGRVMLDGTDDLWVTSSVEGDDRGQWFWPPRM